MQRRQQVGDAGSGAVRGDALEHFGIGVGRLPDDVGKMARKVGRMLAAAAGDFEHQPSMRQHALQNFEDRLAVARDMGEVKAAVESFRHPNEFPLAMSVVRP